MCWLRVSKLYFKKEIKLFGEMYPEHAKNLIYSLIKIGLISYQRVNTDFGQLAIGRYNSLSSMIEIDKLISNNESYKIRQQYLLTNNIRYELVYSGYEMLYSSRLTGITLPEPTFNVINKFNYEKIFGGCECNV